MNVSNVEDIYKLYESQLFSIRSLRGFMTGLIFDVYFQTGFMQPGMEVMLLIDVKVAENQGHNAYKMSC